MRIDGYWADVQILDASSRGFLIHAAHSPPRGSYIELYRGRRRYVARVVWQTNQRCGVRTQDALSVDDLIKPPETQTASIASNEPAVERRERRRVSESIKQRGQSSRHIGRMVEYASIVGLGGAGFPTFIKLNPGPAAKIDTLILNGVECEPYISCDEALSPSTQTAPYQGL